MRKTKPRDGITRSIKWKLEKHHDLANVLGHHSLLKDLVSKEYRDRSFSEWNNISVKLAIEEGCLFSEKTPPTSLIEVFLKRIYDVPGFIPGRDDVVVDVGANYGDTTVWWGKRHGASVIAFEPLEGVFEILKENVKLNELQVELHNTALGDGKNLSGHLSGSMFVSSETSGQMSFKSVTLDSLGMDRIDILKIDVEGFEYEVLSGAKETLRRTSPRIIIETHSKLLKKKCHALLTDLDYELSFKGRKLKPLNPEMDVVQNLFYSRRGN